MELILNELSLEGQFASPSELREAILRVVDMRAAAKNNASVGGVSCSGTTGTLLVKSAEGLGVKLDKVLPPEKMNQLRFWIGNHSRRGGGPFWDEDWGHDPDNELYEHNGVDVRNTGLAEAAHRRESEIDCRMVSFAPSSWECPSLTVTHWDDVVYIPNYWDMSALKPAMEAAEAQTLGSWPRLEEISRRRFPRLEFTSGSFNDMDGRPFARGVAEKILVLLDVLNKICTYGFGSSTGIKLRADHFGGEGDWFSNETKQTREKFRKKLTFPVNGVDTLCSWHGKVNTRTLPYRIHFTWPPTSDGKIYVVYVGDKLTK